MIKCEDFYNLLIENGIDFFCGVPDSTLKYPIAYITNYTGEKRNIIAANQTVSQLHLLQINKI